MVGMKNYTPVDPKQLFHNHVVILTVAIGGIYAGVNFERTECTKAEKNSYRGLITNESVLKQEQDSQ